MSLLRLKMTKYSVGNNTFFSVTCCLYYYSIYVGILTIAATNKPWRMHSDVVELFEKNVYVPLPDISTRALIFQRNIPPGADLTDEDIRFV